MEFIMNLREWEGKKGLNFLYLVNTVVKAKNQFQKSIPTASLWDKIRPVFSAKIWCKPEELKKVNFAREKLILKDEFSFLSILKKSYCVSKNYIYEYKITKKKHRELKRIMPLVNMKMKYGFFRGHYGFQFYKMNLVFQMLSSSIVIYRIWVEILRSLMLITDFK